MKDFQTYDVLANISDKMLFELHFRILCFALIRSPPFTSNLIFPTSWKLQEKIPFVNAVSKTSPHKLLLHSLHLNYYACVSFQHSWKCFWDTLHVHELMVWLWECRVKNQKTLKISSFPSQDARLQELDEEHSLLQSGLQVIEKARKWYFKRITAIQEEKLHLQNEDQYSLEQVTGITCTRKLFCTI